MEKKMENDMETGIIERIIGDCSLNSEYPLFIAHIVFPSRSLIKSPSRV